MFFAFLPYKACTETKHSASCSGAPRRQLLKGRNLFLIQFPSPESQNQRRIKPKTLRWKKKKIPLFSPTTARRVTGRDVKVWSSSSQVSCPFCLTALPASGGISVQVGLSLYIPAPSCHAGDYVKAWRSGGWCSLLPFACCQ